MHNIRNFDYRTEADFTTDYYDKTFDLRQLQSADLVASYWAGPAIAHIFLSFGFGADGQLARTAVSHSFVMAGAESRCRGVGAVPSIAGPSMSGR